jgi:VanZ family protein
MNILKRHLWTLIASLAIIIVSLIPIPEIKPLEDIPLMDKWTHFVMYGGLACAAWFDIYRSKTQVPTTGKLLLAIVYPILLGGLMELGQAYLTTCRNGDWLDFIANTIGAIIAIPIGAAIKRILAMHQTKVKNAGKP